METCGITKICHKSDCDDYHCECDEIIGTNIKKIYFHNNNKIEGIYKEYHFDGQITAEINYIDGKKHGKCIYYLYIHFLKEDTDLNYDENTHKDIISTICNYVDDKLNGEYIHYDMDGNIERICYYNDNNKIDGEFCNSCRISYKSC